MVPVNGHIILRLIDMLGYAVRCCLPVTVIFVSEPQNRETNNVVSCPALNVV